MRKVTADEVQTSHFKHRASERLGGRFKARDIKQILRKIELGQALVVKEGDPKTYEFKLKNAITHVTYSHVLKKLITIVVKKDL